MTERKTIVSDILKKFEPASLEYDSLLLKKYGAEKTKASTASAGQDADSFFDQVMGIYSEPYQQSYITALKTLTPIAAFALPTITSIVEKTELSPRMTQIFPLDQNTHLMDLKDDDEELIKARLIVNPELVTEVIQVCNVAHFQIKNRGIQIVKNVRDYVRQVIQGSASLPNKGIREKLDLTFKRFQIDVISKQIGSDFTENTINSTLNQQITSKTLQLRAPKTAGVFKEIAEQVSYGIDPFDLNATVSFELQLALDEMDIHPNVGQCILDLYSQP